MATSETSAEADRVAVDPSIPPEVSIVVPTFNEASRISESLRRIEAFLKLMPWRAEVLVVDDGSRDQTSSIVAGMPFPGLRLIRNDRNKGKGFSVKAGVLAATGNYVLFSDADLSTPIEELQKLMAVVREQGADVVIGSRAVDRSFIEKHQSPVRELGGMFFNLMVQALLGLRIRDTQCGFKLFKRERIRPVFEKMTIYGFGFDPELLFLASRARLKILEVPVRWSHAEGSKIRFMKDSVSMFSDLIRIRWNQLKGRYS